MESTRNFQTNGDIPLKKIYTSDDVADIDYERDVGASGEPPYTRGLYPEMYRNRPWSIRQFTGHGTPEETNEWFKYEYEHGETGFSVAFDVPTESGIDSDDPRADADVGVGGVACDSVKDLEVIFDGLPIDKVSTSLVAGTLSTCQITAMYFALAEKRGISPKEIRGTGGTDMISDQVCMHHMDQIPPQHQLKLCVDLTEWSCKYAPRWLSVNFDSYNHRESGVTAAQELAFLFINLIGYTEEALKRGNVTIDELAPCYAYNMALDMDFFEEIAKLRAARRMLYKILKERFGAKDPRSWRFRVHVQTAGSTHTLQQPLNNVVRVAYEVMAAALGGAQSVHANSYDEAVCLPTEESLLLALRTQQVAQLETNVTNVVDPLGGSYYVEWLTNEVEKGAWQYLEKIEQAGGLVKIIESGWAYNEFTKAMVGHQKRIESGERKIVGINCFVGKTEPFPGKIFRPNPRAGEIQAEKLRELRQERDNQQAQNALDQVRRDTEAGNNVMPAVMEAAKAYCTIGEMCSIWRDIYGIWRLPVVR